jgi:hypothetical protein
LPLEPTSWGTGGGGGGATPTLEEVLTAGNTGDAIGLADTGDIDLGGADLLDVGELHSGTSTIHGSIYTGETGGQLDLRTGSDLNAGSGRAASVGNNSGSATVNVRDNGDILLVSDRLGFFGASPVAQPSGVAVTAADIHAALVSLGLITA